jgi:hypothetical protein
MRFCRHLLSVVVVISSCVSFLSAAEKTFSSSGVDATVYNDRALVTRQTNSQFLVGKHTLRLSGLPAELNEQSVRVSGNGSAAVKILEVRVETNYSDTIVSQPSKSLQEKIRSLSDELRKMYDRISIVNQQRDFISKISIASQDNIPISRNEQIKIEVGSAKPPEATIEPNGVVTWTISLKPSEQKEMRMRFSVEYPADMSISGLE